MRNNVKTVSALLSAAAAVILASTSTKTGSHTDINAAIIQAAEDGGYRKEVPQRALKLMAHMYPQDKGTPKTKSKEKTFGKRYSESRNEHAVASVFKNRDQRVAALKAASLRAAEHFTKWYV